MDTKTFDLTDCIRIKVDDAAKTIDHSVFEQKDSAGLRRKGLVVTFDLSHSGRRINNRLYTAQGQQAGADSWTQPYAKPIITDHVNEANRIIGRFLDVQWVSTEQEALNHLGSVPAYLEVKRAFDSDDPQEIHKVYSKYNLFNDKEWPGLGKLEARALISDQDAIERFLDGRYLTFSAGSVTDAYTCLACGSEWHTGDICGCRPGETNDEGKIGIFMTGTFGGREGSVITNPADTLSFVKNLAFQDFDTSTLDNDWTQMNTDESTFVLTDSKMEVTSMSLTFKDLMDLEIDTVVSKLSDGTVTLPLADYTSDDKDVTAWLKQVYGKFVVKFADGSLVDEAPAHVVELHNLVKTFKKELTPAPVTDTADNTVLIQLKDEIMTAVKELLDTKTIGSEQPAETEVSNEDAATEAQPVSDETSAPTGDAEEAEKEEDQVQEDQEVLDTATEVDFVDDADIDWFVLDLGIDALVGEDAKLSTEARKELPDSAFCGPERSFPVADCAHVTAARRLIGRAKLSEDQKEKVLACVDRKAKSLGCETDKDCGDCQCGEYNSLKQDYAQALKTIDELQSKLTTVLEAHADKMEATISDSETGTRLDSLTNWFDNVEQVSDVQEDENPIEHIKPVENPSVDSSEGKDSQKKLEALSGFEQKIIQNYLTIRDDKGEDAANFWLLQRSRYLPKAFDISQYIN